MSGHRFVSSTLPPCLRRSPRLWKVLPLLYLAVCRPNGPIWSEPECTDDNQGGLGGPPMRHERAQQATVPVAGAPLALAFVLSGVAMARIVGGKCRKRFAAADHERGCSRCPATTSRPSSNRSCSTSAQGRRKVTWRSAACGGTSSLPGREGPLPKTLVVTPAVGSAHARLAQRTDVSDLQATIAALREQTAKGIANDPKLQELRRPIFRVFARADRGRDRRQGAGSRRWGNRSAAVTAAGSPPGSARTPARRRCRAC